MKLGFLQSMTDTSSALWASHTLIMRLAGLISAAGFDETKRTTAHKGLDITVYVDSLRGSVLAGQQGIAASANDPDVFLYGRASKPSGCDWVAYYVRLRYEAISGASNKLDRFLEMIRAALAAIAQKAKVKIIALDQWEEIAAAIREEVASDTSLHFNRNESEGTVIV
ncbi:hypothetical protein GFL91_03660 [Rhizobium leguminosarum bv. viciae]|uniref:Uncharacterized protein n=1 Tax=Rhizobium leguminosarum bv. viciae TaxID=387 RepID=A0A8I2GK58_RHILV|nr:hypothetical protein [Rhizobium leguminosarum]NKM44105.1 hypothetical protein [Rhizobium leguminosarum bv. viciae]